MITNVVRYSSASLGRIKSLTSHITTPNCRRIKQVGLKSLRSYDAFRLEPSLVNSYEAVSQDDKIISLLWRRKRSQWVMVKPIHFPMKTYLMTPFFEIMWKSYSIEFIRTTSLTDFFSVCTLKSHWSWILFAIVKFIKYN